jgi:poly-gamma-glutamate system protein
MFRPSLKNNWSLVGLALLGIILYYITQSNYTEIESAWYEDKVAAAKKMEVALGVLSNEVRNMYLPIDRMNDPNETGLIGVNVSTITTSRGTLSERLITLNPNFAAAITDLLRNAGLQAGDYVAVGVTGANPGANIALFSAMETLGLNPVIITSVGSATYGANRELFTWLDMERVLHENGVISFYSHYATMGGTNDLGRGLPPEGRDNIIRAVERNHRILLNGEEFEDNIRLRMNAYENQLPDGQRYRAFINVGAGVGNVGSLVNARIISTGIQRRLGERTFSEPGTMMLFAQRNIPVVHIYNINRLVSQYDLPRDTFPMPVAGTGTLFSTRINNVLVASICLFILVAAIVVVIAFDRHDRKFTANIVDPDEEL